MHNARKEFDKSFPIVVDKYYSDTYYYCMVNEVSSGTVNAVASHAAITVSHNVLVKSLEQVEPMTQKNSVAYRTMGADMLVQEEKNMDDKELVEIVREVRRAMIEIARQRLTAGWNKDAEEFITHLEMMSDSHEIAQYIREKNGEKFTL